MDTTKMIMKYVKKTSQTGDWFVVKNKNGGRSVFLCSCYYSGKERQLLAKKGVEKIEVPLHYGFFETQKTSAISIMAEKAVNIMKKEIQKVREMPDCEDYKQGLVCNEDEICIRSGIHSADCRLRKSRAFILGLIDSGRYREVDRYSGAGGWMCSEYMVKK